MTNDLYNENIKDQKFAEGQDGTTRVTAAFANESSAKLVKQRRRAAQPNNSRLLNFEQSNLHHLCSDSKPGKETWDLVIIIIGEAIYCMRAP